MNPVDKAHNYAEHYVDFAIIGANPSMDMVVLQFISNKPTPVITGQTTNEQNHNIDLDIGTMMSHECTVYIGKNQLSFLYEAIGKALKEKDEVAGS